MNAQEQASKTLIDAGCGPHAMKNILPNETRARIKKTGWNAPAHRWFFVF